MAVPSGAGIPLLFSQSLVAPRSCNAAATPRQGPLAPAAGTADEAARRRRLPAGSLVQHPWLWLEAAVLCAAWKRHSRRGGHRRGLAYRAAAFPSGALAVAAKAWFPFPAAGTVAKLIDLEDCSYLAVPQNASDRMLKSDLLMSMLKSPASSFQLVRKGRTKEDDDSDEDEDDVNDVDGLALQPGIGWHELAWRGEPLYLLIAADQERFHDGNLMFILVHGRGRGEHLKAFCSQEGFRPKVSEQSLEIYRAEVVEGSGFRATHVAWNKVEDSPARDMETVVLPDSIKSTVLGDLDKFLSIASSDFFRRHGIPYRRSYLFYGVPGSGKSSMIRALGAKYNRRLCILHPSGPEWRDSFLQKAVLATPKRALVVLEDIDALFSADRQNTAMSGVTFSGLLNALDGVSCKQGTVFIMTTNYRERLDAALTREGRIDLHVPFDYIQPPEVKAMFRQFFPDEADASKDSEFEKALAQDLGDAAYRKLSPAALQYFFIQQFGNSAAKAIENVGLVSRLRSTRNGSARRGFGLIEEEEDMDRSPASAFDRLGGMLPSGEER